MRLTGRSDDEPLSEAWAYLAAAEAIALLEALAVHFEEAQDVPGWHHHVGGDGAAIDDHAHPSVAWPSRCPLHSHRPHPDD